MRFRSYVDGSEHFLGPETSMEVQAALGSDIALVLDECTPFHVTREYTARSTERTHRWLERCLRWHARPRAARSGRLRDRPGRGRARPAPRVGAAVAASGCDGIAIGGSLGREKSQMHEVVAWSTAELERLAPERPRHLLGIGEVDDLIAGVWSLGSTRSTARCRRGSGATASRSSPTAPAGGSIWSSRAGATSAEPILDGLPLPGVRARLLARLPPLPAARRRADRAAAGDAPQPSFVARLMATARGDRGWSACPR